MLFRSPLQARAGPLKSSEEPPHHVTVDIREPKIAPRMSVGQALVVEPEQVQHGSVQIVDVHAIADRLEAKVVSRAMDISTLGPTPGQPHRETVVIVVAPRGGSHLLALREFNRRRPPELAAPDHERVIQ